MPGRVRPVPTVAAGGSSVSTPGGVARVLAEMQNAARDGTARASSKNIPMLDGREVECALLTTDKAFQHKLGRTPVGWFVTDIDALAAVKRSAWDGSTITLVASVAAAAKVWVF